MTRQTTDARRLPLRGVLAALCGAVACSGGQPIAGLPAERPRLSDGICPIIHCNTWQTDALPVRGPERASGPLEPGELDHLWSSPIAGGILDHVYPDGRRVFWVPQVDRVMKLALGADGSFVKLAELPLEPRDFPRRSPEEMRAIVAELDATPLASDAYAQLADRWMDYQLEGLRAYYAMVTSHGVLYVGNRTGIVAYTDAVRGDPTSAIAKAGEFVFDKLALQLGVKMPFAIMLGINITPDGHLVAVTIDGTVVVVKPDLSEAVYHSFEGEQIWNGFAVDDEGGIYVASNRQMHKLVWTGGRLSDREADGAWSLPYEVGDLDASLRGGRGTGTAPALMGSETDRDQFVVVADAADVNNLMLLWRDGIPDDWELPAGAASRRVAGILPVNFGDADLASSYSENSATVFDYGAVLANNQVRTNEPMRMPVQLKMKDPALTPRGLQKFQWDRRSRRWRVAWSRADVSSPNSTPVVATGNRQLHVVGLRRGRWVLETLDWDSGSTRAIYTLGASERFNPIMLALQLLPDGDPVYPSFAGIIHLKLGR